MFDYARFEDVFPADGAAPSPYDHHGAKETETLRRVFDGVLFIDRIMKALGIAEVSKAYPPKTDAGLKALHKAIVRAKTAAHPKLSVLYYLLLDFDGVRSTGSGAMTTTTTGRGSLADGFAARAGLPGKYSTLMKGLWHMDRQQFRFALEHLTHPSLPAEFSDEILTVLVQHAGNPDSSSSSSGSSSASDYTLALAYYHAVRPVLATPSSLQAVLVALARTSVPDALAFTRTVAPSLSARRGLFEKLVGVVLQAVERTKPPGSSADDGDDGAGMGGQGGHGQGGATTMGALISCCLERDEEEWFVEYLTKGEGKRSKNARVLLGLRGVVTGQVSAERMGQMAFAAAAAGAGAGGGTPSRIPVSRAGAR